MPLRPRRLGAWLLAGLLLGGLFWWLRGLQTTESPIQEAELEQPLAEARPIAVPTATEARPRLAIVLDDWGYQRGPLQRLRALPGPMTLAVIPRLAHSREVAEVGASLGHEIIVHAPMLAKGGGNPEPGLLKPGLSVLQVRASLEQDFISVPGAVGLNNHEGSLATEDRALMDAVAAVLRDRKAYFLDSVTSPKSVIPAAAQAAGVPWAARRVFLDHFDDPSEIEKALDRAVSLARRRGHCIIIGHPRLHTLAVLEARLPGIVAEGIELVRVSALLQQP